jgi:hypothetical protein
MSEQDLPVATREELTAPGFDAFKWAWANGICSYSGDEHEFLGRRYCRLCREERSDLVRLAKGHRIYSKD